MSNWHAEETYKGLVQLSQGGLRFGPLVNGGGAVALLALLGDLYGKGIALESFTTPMECFVMGIVASGFAYVGSYLTQLRLYNESALGQATKALPHTLFLYITLGLIILSIVLFGVGSMTAVAALTASPGGA